MFYFILNHQRGCKLNVDFHKPLYLKWAIYNTSGLTKCMEQETLCRNLNFMVPGSGVQAFGRG